ncbi:hypothetical protein JW998_09310 [candidate division KSB1 bacterium]|nr:hypothetical protein [candidate division KSB1 bacterium]
MDILFLTVDEPNSAENWRLLREKCPDAKRIFIGQQASDIRRTVLASINGDHLFLVFAHNMVARDFSFVPPEDLADDTVYIWKSRNPIFCDHCHFYGVILLAKPLVQNAAQPHIISFPGLCAKLKFVDEIASDYNYNLSPFWAWRAGFLQMLNVTIHSYQNDDRQYADRQLWTGVGNRQTFADWAARGAVTAQILARYLQKQELVRRYSDPVALTKEFQLEKRLAGDGDDAKARMLERYSAFGLTLRQIGPKKYFFSSDLTHIRAIGDDEMVNLLQQCHDFKDPLGQAMHCCAAQNRRLLQVIENGGSTSRLLKILSPLVRIFAGQTAELPLHKHLLSRTAAVISRLAADGLLVSDRYIKREIFRFLAAGDPPNGGDHPTVRSMNIPTKNRPRLLKRALQSYAENAALYDHRVVLNVVDDSSDQAVMQENRTNLKEIARTLHMAAIYTTREDRRHFAAQLHRLSGIPLPLCQFCLLGHDELECTTGACRNTIQLQTAGEWCIQVDDDTVCRCMQSPFFADRVALCAYNMYDYIFHPDDSFYETIEYTELDFIGSHEQLLSANIASPALQRHLTSEDKLVIDDLDSALLKKIVASNSAIRATFLGAFGDSGECSSLHRLFASDRAFQELVADESEYEKLLCTRYVSKVVPSLTITDIRSCMTMNIGLDNTVVPIPFSPIQRNEDAVFAHLYHIGYLDGLMGLQPYAINHAPPFRVPMTKEQQLGSAAVWGLNDCLNALLARFRPSSKDAFYNLQQAGRFLLDFSDVELPEFEHSIQEIYCEDMAKKLILLQTVLDERAAAPSFWSADMHRLAQELQKSLTGEGAHMLIDLAGDLQTRILTCKLFISRFGDMLVLWEDIVSAARELRKRGVRLGVEIFSPTAA